VIGDYSSALAAAPVIIGQLKYGREAESEADAFSFDLLCRKGIDPAKTAQLFDDMSKKDSKLGDLVPEFLHSHPGNAYRAKLFRERCPAAS
jgi:predicted Zn-dependent protease